MAAFVAQARYTGLQAHLWGCGSFGRPEGGSGAVPILTVVAIPYRRRIIEKIPAHCRWQAALM